MGNKRKMDWQEKLLGRLLDEKLIQIKNQKLIVTKKFLNIIEKDLGRKLK
mgnify:CR=1 FL=1